MKTIIATSYYFLITASMVLAQNTTSGGRTTGDGSPVNFSLPRATEARSIEQLLSGVAGFLLTIAIPIATIMIIVGAFQILMSGGSPEKVTTGKKTILYAAVGIAIIALFRVLMALLADLLGANIQT